MAVSKVQNIIDSLLPKLADRPAAATEIYEQINDVVELIARRLWFHRSDLVKASKTVTVDGVNASFTLDDRFLGLRGSIYEVPAGTAQPETELWPLAEDDEPRYLAPGTPQFYQLIGNTVTVYPPPTKSRNYVVRYYALPTVLAAPSDSLPFNGFFDSLIKDMMLEMARGVFSVADQVFAQTLNESVDKMVRFRPNRVVRFRAPV